MLGAGGEADDAVQETWLRVSRADASDVENLAGWLTTITARVCLNMLQARRSRPEEPAGTQLPEPAGHPDGRDPEDQVLIADSVGQALLVVLDTLAPAERVAFVLHDMFAVPFEKIALIVDRSPAAARQLASRARRRLQGTAPAPSASGTLQRELVTAFLAASQNGDFTALLELLHPEVVYRADQAGVRMGGPGEVRGSAGVAAIFSGRAQAAQLALIDGIAGIVWAPGGQARISVPRPVKAVESGTRHRAAGRPAHPRADPERRSSRRHPLRGRRRNRRHPHRRPNAPAPRPPRRHACPRGSIVSGERAQLPRIRAAQREVMAVRAQAVDAELADRPVKGAGRRLHVISREVRMCRRSIPPADSASSQMTGH
jgi:RNA polymerase sigma factor (sigma-70 family)